MTAAMQHLGCQNTMGKNKLLTVALHKRRTVLGKQPSVTFRPDGQWDTSANLKAVVRPMFYHSRVLQSFEQFKHSRSLHALSLILYLLFFFIKPLPQLTINKNRFMPFQSINHPLLVCDLYFCHMIWPHCSPCL